MSLSGKVKSWSDEKGFGFIIPNDGSGDVFVHRKVQGMGMQSSLIPGKEVQYDVVIEKDRPKASLVTGDGVQKVTKPPTLGADFRQVGTIKNMNIEKGYGFITPAVSDANGQDIFMLSNTSTPGWNTFCQGMRVSYTVGINPKTQRPWAENVMAENPYGMMMSSMGYDPTTMAGLAAGAAGWPQTHPAAAAAAYGAFPGGAAAFPGFGY